MAHKELLKNVIRNDVARTTLPTIMHKIVITIGAKKFEEMNALRENNGGAKRGYVEGAKIQPVAGPDFLTQDWSKTQRSKNGVKMFDKDDKPIVYGTAPKYICNVIDPKTGEEQSKETNVLKFLDHNETGKLALTGIFLLYIEEFLAYSKSKQNERGDYDEHLNAVIKMAEQTDNGSNLQTMLSIVRRAPASSKLNLDNCLTRFMITPKKALTKYVEDTVGGQHVARIVETFIELLQQYITVAGNTHYDGLIKYGTCASVIGAFRNMSYSLECAQQSPFQELFYVAIEDYVIAFKAAKAAKAAKAEGTKPTSPAAKAAAADDDDDDDDIEDDDDEDKPAKPSKPAAKKAAAKKAAAKKAAAAAATADDDDDTPPEPTVAKAKGKPKAAAAKAPAATPKAAPKKAAAPTVSNAANNALNNWFDADGEDMAPADDAEADLYDDNLDE